MLRVNVQTNLKEVASKIGRLGEREIRRAASRAINDGMKEATRVAAREAVSQRGLGLKKTAGSKLFSGRRARPANLYSEATASSKPISLKYYTGVRRHGSKVRWRDGRGWREVNRAFKAKRGKAGRGKAAGMAGHWFRRKDQRRLPIEKLTGPPLDTVFLNRTLTGTKVYQAGYDKYQQSLRTQLRKALNKAGFR